MKILVALFVSCLLGIAPAQDKPAPAQGHWEGTLSLPDNELQIAVDLARDAKGAWTGSFAVSVQNVTIALREITVDGAKVKFHVPEAPGTPTFEGAIQADGTLALTMTDTQGNSFQAKLKRTGEAKVMADTASAAVDARFEGDYEGSIVAPNGTLKGVLHVHNQPDKTVKATFDSPDQNAFGMLLSDVVVKESTLSFKLRVAGGAFEGKLSADGQSLDGDWMQSGMKLELKMKRVAEKKADPKP